MGSVATQDADADGIPLTVVVADDAILRVRIERQRPQVVDERQLVERLVRGALSDAPALVLPALIVREEL